MRNPYLKVSPIRHWLLGPRWWPGRTQLAPPMWLGSPAVDLSPVSHACDVCSKRTLSLIFEKQSRIAWILYMVWGVISLTNNSNGVLLRLVGFSLVGLWLLWGAPSAQVADVLYDILVTSVIANTKYLRKSASRRKGLFLAQSFGGYGVSQAWSHGGRSVRRQVTWHPQSASR